jgi:hypothetical protein
MPSPDETTFLLHSCTRQEGCLTSREKIRKGREGRGEEFQQQSQKRKNSIMAWLPLWPFDWSSFMRRKRRKKVEVLLLLSLLMGMMIVLSGDQKK